MRSKIFRAAAAIFAVVIIFGIIAAALVYNGTVLLNGTSADRYAVRGIDISSYQGEVNWPVLASQNIDFAFIKATEGSSFVDPCFEYNFAEAQKCGLSVGAYHFFSFDSGGDTQAENFINTVKPFTGMLPPVIDLEFYGDKEKDPPLRDAVTKELSALLTALEAHYGLKPIIYATGRSYDCYLSGDYADYDIWIRNVITSPRLSDGRQWTFWQYANRGRLDGYAGKEKYIDLNVFGGSRDEFSLYPRYTVD